MSNIDGNSNYKTAILVIAEIIEDGRTGIRIDLVFTLEKEVSALN